MRFAPPIVTAFKSLDYRLNHSFHWGLYRREREFSSYCDIAIAKAGVLMDIDIFFSGSVHFPKEAGAVRTTGNAVADDGCDLSFSGPSLSRRA